MKTTSWLFFCLILLSTACKKDDPANNTGNNTEAAVLSNISYGTDAKQQLDLYLPAGRSVNNTKLFILIHGGGWTEGDKNDFSSYVAELQKRFPDYAIANLNYRLASGGQNLFPTQEMDIKNAVEFLVSKADNHGYSDKIVLMGASAGAHLALLQAYKYTGPVKAEAVVSFFGPTDLVTLYNNSGAKPALAATFGGTPTTNPDIYEQSSPITFVTQASTPTLLLHGGQDQTVPITQANILNDLLQSNGVTHQLIVYPNEGHGWFGETLIDSFNKIELFLDAHVP